jgi:hypothetical protein
MVPGPGERWYLQNKGGYLQRLAVVRWVVAGWTTGGGDTLGAKVEVCAGLGGGGTSAMGFVCLLLRVLTLREEMGRLVWASAALRLLSNAMPLLSEILLLCYAAMVCCYGMYLL